MEIVRACAGRNIIHHLLRVLRCAAPRALLSVWFRLIVGAIIPLLTLLLVCALQYWIASDCNQEIRYDENSTNSRACFDQDVAFIGFMLLAPIVSLFGATVSFIAVVLSGYLTHRSTPLLGRRIPRN